MKNIDKLNGRAFERYLTVQFRHLGYHVTLTSYSHDYGADLVLRKWGKKIVVQAKRYERKDVYKRQSQDSSDEEEQCVVLIIIICDIF